MNQQYIRSAAQDDAFRTEPPFKLQGSYRNMNKLAEKVVSAMNDEELEQLVDDHYRGESQTLTTGAEQNLLKLAELRGRMTGAAGARWTEIKEEFVRTRRAGRQGRRPVARVTGTLGGLDASCSASTTAIGAASAVRTETRADEPFGPYLAKLDDAVRTLGKPSRVELRVDDGTSAAAVSVVNVVREHAKAIERVIANLAELMKSGATSGQGATPPGQLGERIEELVTVVRRLEQRLSTLGSTRSLASTSRSARRARAISFAASTATMSWRTEACSSRRMPSFLPSAPRWSSASRCPAATASSRGHGRVDAGRARRGQPRRFRRAPRLGP